jgi:hypothetical protein
MQIDLKKQRAQTAAALAKMQREQRKSLDELHRQTTASQQDMHDFLDQSRKETEKMLAEMEKQREQTMAEFAEQQKQNLEDINNYFAESQRHFSDYIHSSVNNDWFENFRSNLGDDATKSFFEDIFSDDEQDMSSSAKQKSSESSFEPSPADQKRQEIMSQARPEVAQTLGTFDPSLINSVIATVSKAREVSPDRTDWNIHMAYRRSIETEHPDQTMVLKTQISGLLLEGTRVEAHYIF